MSNTRAHSCTHTKAALSCPLSSPGHGGCCSSHCIGGPGPPACCLCSETRAGAVSKKRMRIQGGPVGVNNLNHPSVPTGKGQPKSFPTLPLLCLSGMCSPPDTRFSFLPVFSVSAGIPNPGVPLLQETLVKLSRQNGSQRTHWLACFPSQTMTILHFNKLPSVPLLPGSSRKT